jgi:four helix bundle protein
MQESPIFTKTHDLLLWLIPTTLKFPREQRFVLGKRVQEKALDFQEIIMEAALSRGRRQAELLIQADLTLAKLRSHLRLCHELHLLQDGQYRHVAEKVTEIGRLLGGWRKSTA